MVQYPEPSSGSSGGGGSGGGGSGSSGGGGGGGGGGDDVYMHWPFPLLSFDWEEYIPCCSSSLYTLFVCCCFLSSFLNGQ